MVKGRPDHGHTLEVGTGEMHETVLSSCRRRYRPLGLHAQAWTRYRDVCDSVLFDSFQVHSMVLRAALCDTCYRFKHKVSRRSVRQDV